MRPESLAKTLERLHELLNDQSELEKRLPKLFGRRLAEALKEREDIRARIVLLVDQLHRGHRLTIDEIHRAIYDP